MYLYWKPAVQIKFIIIIIIIISIIVIIISYKSSGE